MHSAPTLLAHASAIRNCRLASLQSFSFGIHSTRVSRTSLFELMLHPLLADETWLMEVLKLPPGG
jgi:hypothetical protein